MGAPWGIEYVMDDLNAYILVVLLFLSLACVIYSKRNIEHELPQKVVFFYNDLPRLLITGLCGTTVAGDIFNMYVFVEITCPFCLCLDRLEGKDRPQGKFHLSGSGFDWSLFFLLGIGFLYAITGSF